MKRFISVLIALLIAFTVSVSAAEEKLTEGDYEYRVNDSGTVEITRYYGTEENLTLPEKLGGKKVVAVGDFAFNGNKYIKNLVVPKGINNLGEQSFSVCKKLETVTLSDTVRKIWYNCFRGCEKLKSANLGDGLEYIDERAFAFCTGLTDVSVGISIRGIFFAAFRESENLSCIRYSGTEAAWEKVYIGTDNEPVNSAQVVFAGKPVPELKADSVKLNAGECSKIVILNSTAETVSYESSNARVACISGGKVVALKKGSAIITVTTGVKRLEYSVKVTSSPQLSKSSISVTKGKYAKVRITGKAAAVDNSYSKSNYARVVSGKKATVLKIKGIKRGKGTLKIKVNGVALKLTVKVK